MRFQEIQSKPPLISLDHTPRGSAVETLDGRAQVVVYLCLTTSVLVVSDWRFLVALSAIPATIALFARLTWRETRGAWIWLLVLTSIFAVPNLLFGKGFDYTMRNALKLLATFLATIVVVRTIDPRTYGVIWRGFGAPDKLAFVMNLMMRYVPTLIHDFEATKDAQRARGLELESLKGGFITRVRRLAPLLIPVFARSVAESTDVEQAMDMRAFGSAKRRTWLRELHFHARDIVAITGGLALVASCVVYALLGRA